MAKVEALWDTPKASQYLQQLCKHFAHKIDVSFTPEEGRIDFPFGPVNLKASDAGLWIEVNAADAEGLERAKDVVDRHLERFAFRDDFKHMPWAA
ncbi:DUF2218 domain-containing protein [uncultured Maritimibacter sp.]|jgi:hypothetical protein|uniref:DUF2218 domain-containing protein n=1 Tax=uncultured Maritimibacter sp. TaxID=991866 RepID=UPI0026174B29|nr:DUF2218 domain-containing protein [uncultured Maritimibacter sp.]